MIDSLKKYITKDRVKQFLLVAFGVMVSAFSYSFFLRPNNVVIGGVSGIGVMVNSLGKVDDSLIMLIINIGLMILSLIFSGKDFFLKTVFGASVYPVFTYIFNLLYDAINIDFSTIDPMLVIIFSALIMGCGLGIAVKHGGSTGGTEIPQKMLYDKLHLSYSISLFLIDGTVILTGFFIMNQSLDFLLYEILFVYLCGQIMDAVIFSGFNKRAIHIISDKCDEIRDVLIKDFSRGVTGVRVFGEYSRKEKKMLVCVMSSLEYNKLRDIIGSIDSKAFFYCMKASEVRGEGFTYASDYVDKEE